MRKRESTFIQFWRRITGKYIDPTKLKTENKGLYVINVNPESDNLSDALGIDEERKKWLAKLVLRSYHNNTDVVSTLTELSKEVGHANELAYCTYIMAVKHQEQGMGPGGLLAKLLPLMKDR